MSTLWVRLRLFLLKNVDRLRQIRKKAIDVGGFLLSYVFQRSIDRPID